MPFSNLFARLKITERPALFIASLALTVPLLGWFGFMVLEKAGGAEVPVPEIQESSPAVEHSAPPLRELRCTFRRNENITDALLGHGLSREEVYRLVEDARPAYDLTRVIAGREYDLYFTGEGGFHELRYRIDAERYLTVYRHGERFVPLVKRFAFENRTAPVAAVIEGSLFTAVTESGEQDLLALELARIFMWDVDFYTDIQKGDSFRMLVEKRFLDGAFDSYGPILAAEITVQNKTYSGYLFQGDYYSPDGKALRKSFLKSPLKFARISSRFSLARRHPILKIVRPHLGVDYAAPTGTPVVAVASGRVTSAGRNGGYGKSVRLRHIRGYETMYSHLSRIAVRNGAQVSQGDIIGYVGATGLATGPHLDFRLIQRGRFVNPATAIVPPAPPVSAEVFPAFSAICEGLQGRLQEVIPGGLRVAAAERSTASGDAPAAGAESGSR